jgi:hypothetical protein
MARLGSVVVVLVGLVGCGGDDAVGADAAPTDAEMPDGLVATAPDIPWLADGVPPIAIAPCPAGWREVDDGSGVTTCDAYPEGGALDCPDGEAHFPGEPGCAPVGSRCPTGDFSESLPADTRIVYVRPGATGGTGMTPSTPYGSVSDFSVGSLPIGAVVALSGGTHVGPVRLTRGVVLWGACAVETLVTTPEPADFEGVITFVGSGAARDLAVRDSPRPGVWLADGGVEGTLDGVVVSDVENAGVIVGEGRLVASTLVVRRTRAESSDGAFGRGVTLELGATVALSRVLLEDNRESAAYAQGTGTALTLTDAVLRRTQGRESDGLFGRGLNVELGATAELSRVLLADNLDIAVLADGVGTAVTLSDVVVGGLQDRGIDGASSQGLAVQAVATAEVSRALFEDNHERGVFVEGTGTEATLTDVVVRRTQSRWSDGHGGRGLGVQAGAAAEMTRGLLENNREIGVFVDLANAAVTLADVVVRGTRGRDSDGIGGRGVNLQRGATAELSRALVEDNRDLGLFASENGCALTLTDVVVRRTQSQPGDGLWGRGLTVQRGAMATGSRVRLEHNHDIGVYTSGGGTEVTLRDVVVQDTLPRACADTACPDASAGHGVSSLAGATLALVRFVVEQSHLCGVLLARDGQVDLMDGEVRDNPIGVCMQVDGYDTERLTASVRFVDNGTNLQTTELPIPEPAAALPSP